MALTDEQIIQLKNSLQPDSIERFISLIETISEIDVHLPVIAMSLLKEQIKELILTLIDGTYFNPANLGHLESLINEITLYTCPFLPEIISQLESPIMALFESLINPHSVDTLVLFHSILDQISIATEFSFSLTVVSKFVEQINGVLSYLIDLSNFSVDNINLFEKLMKVVAHYVDLGPPAFSSFRNQITDALDNYIGDFSPEGVDPIDIFIAYQSLFYLCNENSVDSESSIIIKEQNAKLDIILTKFMPLMNISNVHDFASLLCYFSGPENHHVLYEHLHDLIHIFDTLIDVLNDSDDEVENGITTNYLISLVETIYEIKSHPEEMRLLCIPGILLDRMNPDDAAFFRAYVQII